MGNMTPAAPRGLVLPILGVVATFFVLASSAATDAPRTEWVDEVPAEASEEGRIVGGTLVNKANEFPYMVLLAYSNGDWAGCGASLISPGWILSAAHCFTKQDVKNPGRLQARLGFLDSLADREAGSESIAIKRVIIHPGYKGDGYDIALLQLSRASTFEPVHLATKTYPVGTNAIVSGWGTTSENGPVSRMLRQVTVPLVSRQECDRAMGNVKSDMICAGVSQGGKDSCYGDSGGPWATKRTANGPPVQLGIVSWGSVCAKRGTYGVYTEVQDYIVWIQNKGVVINQGYSGPEDPEDPEDPETPSPDEPDTPDSCTTYKNKGACKQQKKTLGCGWVIPQKKCINFSTCA